MKTLAGEVSRLIAAVLMVGVVGLIAPVSVSAQTAPPAAPKAGPVKPPVSAPIERITARLIRVGSALVDTEARTITCPGVINMDSGAMEYLAVAPRGKTHESLLRVDVRPLHLQLALLLLGLEPKNVLRVQGERTTPQGAPVEIRVRWRDARGQMQDVRAETLILRMPGRQPMTAHEWVFTGSRILREGFEADLEKSLVAVWHDPAAILDNPLASGGDNAYVVNALRTPKRGTPIEFVIKARPLPVGAGK